MKMMGAGARASYQWCSPDRLWPSRSSALERGEGQPGLINQERRLKAKGWELKIQERQGKGQGELAGANFQDLEASAWTAFCSLLVDKLWKESGSL